MNWFRTILDGVAMSAVFNGVVAVFCPAVGFIAAGIGMLIR